MSRSPIRAAAVFGALLLVLACDSAPRTLAVEPLPSPTGNDAAEPFVARASDGTVFLSWLERAADSSVALRFSSLDQTTRTWTAPREVMSRRDLFVNWADFPSVVPLTNGRLLAHWLQRNGAGRYSYDVVLSESLDGGVSWGPTALPHPPMVQAEHGFVSILPTADGGAVISLLDGTAGGLAAASAADASEGESEGLPMQLAYARWTDGAVSSTATLDTRVCDCCQTASAMTTRGPVIVYRDRTEDEIRDMYVVREVDGKWTEPVALSHDNWRIDFCPVNGPAVGAIENTVAAVWFTGAQDTARVQIAFSTDAGATFGSGIRVDGGLPTGRVDVEMLDKDAAFVSWIERLDGGEAEVRARVVRRNGTLEPHIVVSPSSGTRSSGFPRMARSAEGVVMAWTIPGTPSTVRTAIIRIDKP